LAYAAIDLVSAALAVASFGFGLWLKQRAGRPAPVTPRPWSQPRRARRAGRGSRRRGRL